MIELKVTLSFECTTSLEYGQYNDITLLYTQSMLSHKQNLVCYHNVFYFFDYHSRFFFSMRLQ